MKNIFKNNFHSVLNAKNVLKPLAVALGLTVVSCSDILKEEVYSSFTADNFYESVGAAELGMYGIYDGITNRNTYAQDYYLNFDQGSDHQRYWRQNRPDLTDYNMFLSNYQIDETNIVISRAWESFYHAIYRANLVIDRVELWREKLAADASLSPEEVEDFAAYNNVLGDAYFLRGFIYFQLTKQWGDVPLKLSAAPSLEGLKVKRDPQKMVYEQIEKDLLRAIALLPNPREVRSVGRVSKTAAQGILARVYLNWAGEPMKDTSKYAKAVEQSLAVIQSGEHRLLTNIEKLVIGGNDVSPVVDPKTDGPDAFKDYFPEVFNNVCTLVTDPTEIMWELQFAYPGETTSDAGKVGSWYGILQHTNSSYKRGGTRWYALPTFYNSFNVKDSLRRDWSIGRFEIKADDQFTEINFASGSNTPKLGIGKFRRYLQPTLSAGHNDEMMNLPIIRYADVLLMYAEAVNEVVELGGSLPAGASISDAVEAVNLVRRRAMPNEDPGVIDISYTDGSTFRQEIRDERSWELCFERVRKPDLIRWGILGETLRNTKQQLVALGYDNEYVFVHADNFDDAKHTKLPIPFSAEISQNPEILSTDPTNNGYR